MGATFKKEFENRTGKKVGIYVLNCFNPSLATILYS